MEQSSYEDIFLRALTDFEQENPGVLAARDSKRVQGIVDLYCKKRKESPMNWRDSGYPTLTGFLQDLQSRNLIKMDGNRIVSLSPVATSLPPNLHGIPRPAGPPANSSVSSSLVNSFANLPKPEIPSPTVPMRRKVRAKRISNQVVDLSSPENDSFLNLQNATIPLNFSSMRSGKRQRVGVPSMSPTQLPHANLPVAPEPFWQQRPAQIVPHRPPQVQQRHPARLFGAESSFGAATSLAPAPSSSVPESKTVQCPVCQKDFKFSGRVEEIQVKMDMHVEECLSLELIRNESAPQPPTSIIPAEFNLSRSESKFNVFTLEKSSEKECTICFEQMEAGEVVSRLDCWCMYHKDCISEWFKKSSFCPLHKPSETSTA